MTQSTPRSTTEPEKVQSPLLRAILILCGLVALLVGFIGIFLPVLPTAPFILVAAACFARSSKRFYNLLADNRYFGQMVREFREHQRIPRKTKIYVTCLIIVSVGSSIIFFIPLLIADITVALIVSGVLYWIWSYPD